MWQRLTRAISSAIALGLLAGCGQPAARPAPTPAIQPLTETLSLSPDSAEGATEKAIAELQTAIRERGGSAEQYARLGAGYLQRWRETADPSFYGKAEPALDKALELDPSNVDALIELGALASSRHDFGQALAWAGRAIEQDGHSSAAYGVKADALVELGRYQQAIDTIQRMVDLRPDLSSYSRVSYIRELTGDTPNAILAMRQAVAAGAPTADDTAWARYQLGMLYFNSGQLDAAEQEFQAALHFLPGYVHARAGLALVSAARGDYDGAIALYKPVTDTLPLPQYVIELGDVYAASGRDDLAQQQYELVGAMEQLYQASGANVDMEMALFDADHDRHLDSLVDEGQRGVRERPSILGHDALAWTLYKAGRYEEAEAEEKLAMSTGMKNALFQFHMGMIQLGLAHTTEGSTMLRTALAINPYFSLRYAPLAHELTA